MARKRNKGKKRRERRSPTTSKSAQSGNPLADRDNASRDTFTIAEQLRSLLAKTRKRQQVRPQQERRPPSPAGQPLKLKKPQLRHPAQPKPAELPVIEVRDVQYCRNRLPVPPIHGPRISAPPTQVRQSRERREIAIGLDVGTSCTKVVIRDVDTGDSFAVPLGDLAAAESSYLLPSIVGLAKNGVFRHSTSGHCFRDFKTSFVNQGDEMQEVAEGYPKVSMLEVFTAYVAIVLCMTRDWFLKEFGTRYADYRLIWHVNIGMPTNALQGHTLTKAFRIAAFAGWLTSLKFSEPSLGEVRLALETAIAIIHDGEEATDIERSDTHPELVGAFPEVVAEVKGYAASDLRRPGLHFMIDVGAETLDLATFTLVAGEESETYPILENNVYRLGAGRLFKHRETSVRRSLRNKGVADRDIDRRLQKLVEDTVVGGALPDPQELCTEVERELLSGTDRSFSDSVRQGMARILKRTQSSRDPNARAWEHGLPTFLCGGGSAERLFPDAIQKVQSTYPALKRGFKVIPLPQPEGFHAPGLPPGAYHRLAVATGLAFRAFDIGELVRPDQIEDIEPSIATSHLSESYVSKEMT